MGAGSHEVQGMLRLTFLTCCVLLLTGCGSDESESVGIHDVAYESPVDYDITLAGNFGEPRPFHFHGGIDVKTGNVEGKDIFTIADGYVSRLTVNKYGFGNAIYVSHPDGKTSVYCHLKRFADQYEDQLQRTGSKDTLSVVFPADKFPVKAGDHIAISGNTGHSTGPHLHLELHDTDTWVLRDPLMKLASIIADTVAPQAHSFMAYPMDGEGVFNGGLGRVGFALWADDYSEATYNHYGIRYTRLLVDGREVFRSDVDSIPISCQLEVNLWGDYDHWRRTRVWYMKSFREPGMRLPILHTNFEQGIVCFSEERPYHLTYILRDYQGNESRYHFTVRGERYRGITPHPRRTLLNDYLLFRQVTWPLHTPVSR